MALLFGRNSCEYAEVSCTWCGRMIAGNWIARHERGCSERIHKAPIETLNFGEIKAAGRLEEMRAALRRSE